MNRCGALTQRLINCVGPAQRGRGDSVYLGDHEHELGLSVHSIAVESLWESELRRRREYHS